ncbi:PBSX family phage terminase large subunit [Actinomadura hibisca]|uniref:PBSX family phage terminase large subunit n=1 Tax=Actinomadura hibisca TaxID=68565 RepID=UPI000831E0BC|nr:PBSX family phage terminase large subunit [Actinomadura hibisca]
MSALDLARVTSILSPKQITSITESARARISIWAGAVRSGKTLASLLAFLIAVAAAPDHGLIVIVGRTRETIERNVIEPLQDTSLFGPLAAQVHHTRGSNTAVILGRTVHLIGAHDVRAEGRLRGLTACLAYVDEATLLQEAFFSQLLARLSVPGARLLATTNPDGPQHWLRQQFLLRAPQLDLAHWHFTLDDNPALPAEYVTALRAEFVGLWYRRMILGEWCLAEGAVFDMWDPERHVVDVLPPIRRWIGLGIDYGTTNPFAALLLGMGTDNVLYLANEWRWDSKAQRRQLTDHEYSQRLRAWLDEQGVRPQWTIVDPSAASFLTQLWQDGLSPVHGDNAVLDGIRTLSSLLARDRLRVHRRCQGWINEVPGYSWDPDKAARGEDAPIKADDHSLDAGRYVVHTTQTAWRSDLREAA